MSAETLRIFVRGVFNLMRHMGMLAGVVAADPAPAPLELVGNGNLDQTVLAPCDGHFRAEVGLLQPVLAGQRLGAIYDLLGNVLADIVTPVAGRVILLRALHRVRVGDGVAHVV